METNDNSIPDFIAKDNFKGDWGNVSIAGIARQLKYKESTLNPDAYIDGKNELSTIDQTGANIAYRHFWSDTTRSTLGYVIYDAGSTAGVYNEKSQSIHINLLFSSLPKLRLGSEVIYGKLEKSNGDSGEMNRLQFSAKYSF